MSAVETLREAARLMRERAEAATPGPWTVVGGRYVNGGTDPVAGGQGDLPQGNAAYIAAMHPGVVLAVADWLDNAALDVDRWGTDKALAVARAYLGETS